MRSTQVGEEEEEDVVVIDSFLDHFRIVIVCPFYSYLFHSHRF